MKYRKFGALDWDASVLGFGTMRLPVVCEGELDPPTFISVGEQVDEELTVQMLRHAVDHGLNYIDTAYNYHGGSSEVAVGKALKAGYRDKVKLATKMPTWIVKTEQDLHRIFEEQFGRLDTDAIDFYLLHNMVWERWPLMKEVKAFQWAQKEIERGRIKHLGFSIHDTFEHFKEIVDAHPEFTFCQIQYNYMDTESCSGTPGADAVKYAADKGLAVVIMEPLGGGNLAVTPPRQVQHIWDETETERTPADRALQWLWNQPEVTVVLSGMSTMAQVAENLASAGRSGPGVLSKDELGLAARAREEYRRYGFVGCTACKYCMPCSDGVDIPGVFSLLNEYSTRQGDQEGQGAVKTKYKELILRADNGAGKCTKCGKCEDACPQQLPIRKLLEKAASVFES